jgi:hypothetical protein
MWIIDFNLENLEGETMPCLWKWRHDTRGNTPAGTLVLELEIEGTVTNIGLNTLGLRAFRSLPQDGHGM